MERKQKQTSRAKIDKMVADGTRNYPAYLKLIYTGESELSSEDEFSSAPRGGSDEVSRPSPLTSCRGLTSCFAESRPGDLETTSPGLESTKLKDEGREKVVSPLSEDDGGRRAKRTTTRRREEEEEEDEEDEPCSRSTASMHDSAIGSLSAPSEDQESFKAEKEKELFQIQEEIASLKSLLETKVALANQLKKKLGLTPMSELKLSIRNLRQSATFLKTNAALRSLSSLASKTIGNWRITSPLARRSSRDATYMKQSKSLGNMYEQSEPGTYSSSTSLKLPSID